MGEWVHSSVISDDSSVRVGAISLIRQPQSVVWGLLGCEWAIHQPLYSSAVFRMPTKGIVCPALALTATLLLYGTAVYNSLTPGSIVSSCPVSGSLSMCMRMCMRMCMLV